MLFLFAQFFFFCSVLIHPVWAPLITFSCMKPSLINPGHTDPCYLWNSTILIGHAIEWEYLTGGLYLSGSIHLKIHNKHMVYVRLYDIQPFNTRMVNLRELTFSKRDRTHTLKHKSTVVQSKYIHLIFLHISHAVRE